MSHEHSVLSQVVVRIVRVRLVRFARPTLAQELHLEHLVFVEATRVAIVWLRVWQWFDWKNCDGTR